MPPRLDGWNWSNGLLRMIIDIQSPAVTTPLLSSWTSTSISVGYIGCLQRQLQSTSDRQILPAWMFHSATPLSNDRERKLCSLDVGVGQNWRPEQREQQVILACPGLISFDANMIQHVNQGNYPQLTHSMTQTHMNMYILCISLI